MRCALDASPLLGERTGVATFTLGLLHALVERIDVYGYALSWRGRTMLREVLPPGVGSGWSVPAGPLLRLWAHSDLFTAERILDLDEDVDVVHGTNFVVPPTRAAGRVVTVHDLTSVRYPEMCAPTSRRYPALVRRAVAHGAWVHTPSAFVADEVVEYLGVDRQRVRPIHHGVTATAGDPAEGRAIAVDRAGCERYVLALATGEPRKDLALLVAAFDELAASHTDLALLLAGREGWDESLATSVANARSAARIARLGYVSDDEKGALLAGAAVFAYPSRYEGFGLPPLEAMAAGVPVVASDAGAVREVCGDAATLVAVGDRDGFAGALEAALSASPTSIERARAHAASFTWAACADRMIDLYKAAA